MQQSVLLLKQVDLYKQLKYSYSSSIISSLIWEKGSSNRLVYADSDDSLEVIVLVMYSILSLFKWTKTKIQFPPMSW